MNLRRPLSRWPFKAPQGFGVRQSSAAFVSRCTFQSGRRLPHSKTLARFTQLATLLLTSGVLAQATAGSPRSKTIASVLREPLPPEELKLTKTPTEFVITGPTFSYRVEKKTGAISAIQVSRDGQNVLFSGPAEIELDQYRLSSAQNTCSTAVLSKGKDKVVIEVTGILAGTTSVDFRLVHTFFNDGVLVSEVRLTPHTDLLIENAIRFRVVADGEFSHYLHKCLDEHGGNAARGKLPERGNAVRFKTLTSCLGVFSAEAALAIFTDAGATHLSRTNLDTAIVEATSRIGSHAQVSLTQFVVNVAPGNQPFVLKAGDEFAFRVGFSVAPNRLAHPRSHDLRMFTWIGDAKFPYPTDEEIAQVAQWGFTLFQMHRVGTPGEPRSPAGEPDRVMRKVHELGMLFLWEENADLLYESAPRVRELKAAGEWSLWQGFNYGGHYKARMDPYCDLVATCLASPNGLAEYRLANLERMLDRFDVDGIYLDDNLAYGNCMLWKEHRHPRPVYDCLIELHEMNWRRRELMRRKCPHVVLVSHSTSGFILPVIADFDALLYGEGYSFDSLENYWDNYWAWSQNLPAQGMIWPGDDESIRCAAALAYNFDLLTGGGQYTQLDWRLFRKKFSYAAGVTAFEADYAKTYNLAQYYFGLYESKSFYPLNSATLFSTTTRRTYASVYHNEMWNDWLIPVANMDAKAQKTSLAFHSPQPLGIAPGKNYLLFNVHRRTARTFPVGSLPQGLSDISIPGHNLQLFYLRQEPVNAPFHVWGGKRISERWDARRRKLSLEIIGPAGLRDTIFIAGAGQGIQQLLVGGKRAEFFFDPSQGLAHGDMTFTVKPLRIEVLCSANGANTLPEKAIVADALAVQLRE